MSNTYNGRVVYKGNVSGEALVYPDGLNMLETYLANRRALRGKIVCLSQTIGSTTGGMILQTMIQEGNAPKAMLFSQAVDPLAVAGLVLAEVWSSKQLITVDQLGQDFLETVKVRQQIQVSDSGEVTLATP